MIELEQIQVRDPFIVPYKNYYYMVGTTGTDCWNAGSDLIIYRSADLKSFEPVGAAFDKKLYYDGYIQFWAPEIHHINNKFFMVISILKQGGCRGSHILVSDRIDGGYKPVTDRPATPPELECLDATLYIEDGNPYLIYSHEWVQAIDGALYRARLNDDLTGIIGKPELILSGKTSGFAKEVIFHATGVKGYIAEAPFLYKCADGSIILLWSTVGEKGYCIASAKSENGICGKFKHQNLLFEKDGGHCMVFKDFTGALKITFHQPNNTPHERAKILSLADENGTLRIQHPELV